MLGFIFPNLVKTVLRAQRSNEKTKKENRNDNSHDEENRSVLQK